MKKSMTAFAAIGLVVMMGVLLFGFITSTYGDEKSSADNAVNSLEDGYVNDNVNNVAYMAQPDTLVTTPTALVTTVTTAITTETPATGTTTVTETTSTTTEATTQPQDGETESVEQDAPTEPTEPVDIKPYYYYDEWLWIGDSRTEGLSNCVNIDSFAKGSQGLAWFLNNSETIYAYRYKTIIINLGINDLGNIWNYINTFNNMPDEFIQNNCIYIMSVNPVDEAMEARYGYTVKNSSIEYFNENMRANLREELYFFDTYNYMQYYGFSTMDGVHYTYNTYVDIFNHTVTSIMGDGT